jgi:hypothetical protein
VTDCEAVPPGPPHDSENTLLPVDGRVVSEPAVALAPDHEPEARHDVAWLEVHVSVDAAPLETLLESVRNDTLGAVGGGAAWT